MFLNRCNPFSLKVPKQVQVKKTQKIITALTIISILIASLAIGVGVFIGPGIGVAVALLCSLCVVTTCCFLFIKKHFKSLKDIPTSPVLIPVFLDLEELEKKSESDSAKNSLKTDGEDFFHLPFPFLIKTEQSWTLNNNKLKKVDSVCKDFLENLPAFHKKLEDLCNNLSKKTSAIDKKDIRRKHKRLEKEQLISQLFKAELISLYPLLNHLYPKIFLEGANGFVLLFIFNKFLPLVSGNMLEVLYWLHSNQKLKHVFVDSIEKIVHLYENFSKHFPEIFPYKRLYDKTGSESKQKILLLLNVLFNSWFLSSKISLLDLNSFLALVGCSVVPIDQLKKSLEEGALGSLLLKILLKEREFNDIFSGTQLEESKDIEAKSKIKFFSNFFNISLRVFTENGKEVERRTESFNSEDYFNFPDSFGTLKENYSKALKPLKKISKLNLLNPFYRKELQKAIESIPPEDISTVRANRFLMFEILKENKKEVIPIKNLLLSLTPNCILESSPFIESLITTLLIFFDLFTHKDLSSFCRRNNMSFQDLLKAAEELRLLDFLLEAIFKS